MLGCPKSPVPCVCWDALGLQYTVLLLKLQPSLIPSLLTSGRGPTNQRRAMPAIIKPPHHNPATALPAIYAAHSRHQLSRISLQTVICKWMCLEEAAAEGERRGGRDATSRPLSEPVWAWGGHDGGIRAGRYGGVPRDRGEAGGRVLRCVARCHFIRVKLPCARELRTSLASVWLRVCLLLISQIKRLCVEIYIKSSVWRGWVGGVFDHTVGSCDLIQGMGFFFGDVTVNFSPPHPTPPSAEATLQAVRCI